MLHRQHLLTGHRAAIFALAEDLNAQAILSGGGDGYVVRWTYDTPDPGRVVAQVDGQIMCLVRLEAPDQLVVGTLAGDVHWMAWPKDESPQQASLKSSRHHVKGCFALYEMGAWLFSAGADGVLTRWDRHTQLPQESIRLSHDSLRCIAQRPGSAVLSVGASDGNIYFFDTDKGRLLHTIKEAHGNSVFSLQYTSDGRYLISGGRDAQLRVWDVGEGYTQVKGLPAHWYTLNSIAVHPVAGVVATGSRDKTIKIWSLEDWELLRVIDFARDQGHRNSVNVLRWSGDGRLLVSGSDDRSVMFWEVV